MRKPHTEETKRKISQSLSGKRLSIEVRQKISASRKGKPGPVIGDEFRRRVSEGRRGIPCSQETKNKISAANKGRRIPRSREWNKKISEGLRGHTVSAELRKRISVGFTEKIRKQMSQTNSREGNPNWRGGVSFEPYPPEFNQQLKDRIKARDGNRCRVPRCISKGVLAVHHIDYDKQNCSESNLITLCNSCHSRSNSGRQKAMIFFQSLIRG